MCILAKQPGFSLHQRERARVYIRTGKQKRNDSRANHKSMNYL